MIFFDGGFPSHVFLTLQFCYDAEGNWSLIPLLRKGTRSSMDSSAGSLCTGFVFYVKWLLAKNALHEDGVLYNKENGAESGLTPFSCIQLGFLISKLGWVANATTAALCRSALGDGWLPQAKRTLRIMLNTLMPVPGLSVTSTLLSSEILTNQARQYLTKSSLRAESTIVYTSVDASLN